MPVVVGEAAPEPAKARGPGDSTSPAFLPQGFGEALASQAFQSFAEFISRRLGGKLDFVRGDGTLTGASHSADGPGTEPR